jgi:DNA-binding CsgD family transcriptional regulator
MTVEKLTPAEFRAGQMLCKLARQGKRCRTVDVAVALGITKETAKHYIGGAMEKTGFFSRIEFVLARCALFTLGMKSLGMI